MSFVFFIDMPDKTFYARMNEMWVDSSECYQEYNVRSTMRL